jgi:hypothetical protein
MTRCNEPRCLRAVVRDGAKCEAHTREALTAAFAPEWVRRSRENRLAPRIEGGTYR